MGRVFASGRSTATKLRGAWSQNSEDICRKGPDPYGIRPKSPIDPIRSLEDPCLPRNSAAIRGLVSLFWCLYSQTRTAIATDLRLFSLAYDACRIVNTRWRFRVEERYPAQFPPDHQSAGH